MKAATLTGAQIADGSISGADINGSLTGANISGKVNDADKLDGKDSSEFVSHSEQFPVALKLNAGDVKVLATNGPVKLVARCAEDEAGKDVVEILAETTVSNSFLDGDDDLDGGPLPADFLQPGTLATDRGVLKIDVPTSVTPHSENDIDDGYVLAASGEYLGLDGESTALNFNVAGAKCSLITTISANKL